MWRNVFAILASVRKMLFSDQQSLKKTTVPFFNDIGCYLFFWFYNFKIGSRADRFWMALSVPVMALARVLRSKKARYLEILEPQRILSKCTLLKFILAPYISLSIRWTWFDGTVDQTLLQGISLFDILSYSFRWAECPICTVGDETIKKNK